MPLKPDMTSTEIENYLKNDLKVSAVNDIQPCLVGGCSGNIVWKDIMKKEARGINNEDVGEVQEVTEDYVLVEKGVINKDKFYIPRDLAVGYNGTILIFNIAAEEAKSKYLRDSPPVFFSKPIHRRSCFHY